MKAVVTLGNSKVALKSDVPVPEPGPGQILVKVIAATQNPPDCESCVNVTTGLVIGLDYAGIVVDIGPDVPTGQRYVGERVAGFINGGKTKEWTGTFAEYCLAEAHLVLNLPDSMSFEDASSLGLAGFTACQLLWLNHRALPTPDAPTQKPFPLLVWGGASSVGQYAIQLAKLSGLTVITTTSPKNLDLVKSLAADAAFDYRDPGVISKIKQFTGDELSEAVDCISTKDTIVQVEQSLGKNGGHIATIMPVSVTRPDVTCEFMPVYTLLGRVIDFGPAYQYPVIPKHVHAGERFGKMMSELLTAGKLRANPVKIVPNGLADAQQFEYHEQGKLSAEKTVYRISDTP
ncbi:dehydrogenase [Guyanagaster necrorhizus]|uniref:Dehydrogenase n=1 Tax=Guyanagaster necrorhizus TaxID=856835 RepID=A0A9P8AQC2_9AGAR|nr:dehydrogenase [Guyanagaster necrorhizus MCA 3950]KAG7442717.1 dehydrogenase [Guyanagaster necrorhizus MCA 3950]